MRFTALGLAATAGVANAGLANFPVLAAADSVCTRAPYKGFTALSALPAAQTYCSKEFPLATPTCLDVIKTTKTQTVTGVHTKTVTDASISTVTTGPGHTITVSKTAYVLYWLSSTQVSN